MQVKDDDVRRAEVKLCKGCGKTKARFCFYKDLTKEAKCKPCVRKARKTFYSGNRDRIKQRVRNYRSQYPEKIKDTKLKQDFGITLEQYNKKLLSQDGACAVCKLPETQLWRGKKISLSVDHDHTTGQVRGLLCMTCNRALGLLKENTLNMFQLILYSKKFQKLR